MNKCTADDGVAEVIGFILIIALVVAVAAVWILVYIPAQGNAVETEHSRVVTEEIADIKYGIDLLWTTEQTGMNASRVISPSPVEGTEISGLLFVSPPVGTGTISVSPGTNFTVVHSGGTLFVYAMKIAYNSANYYAPDTRIVYDGGAVFRGQKTEDPYVLLPPSTGESQLVIVAVSGGGEQQILSNIPLGITYKYNSTQTYSGATVTVNASSEYADLWNASIGAPFSGTVTVVKYDVEIGSPQ
ncbi:MAG: hypothetical protein Q7J08_06390 [Methanocorpusculum sp.]|uniref:DUF7289 family protein n=1 Tax=Methanocorpusculum sp. TaxID=2058474 RepID=UPI00271AEB76|nr:hypothetical protein [Methanocorpusculum sp.]MDO9523324.1 hypothetical protein [Methanocorpusculum sp.]